MRIEDTYYFCLIVAGLQHYTYHAYCTFLIKNIIPLSCYSIYDLAYKHSI